MQILRFYFGDGGWRDSNKTRSNSKVTTVKLILLTNRHYLYNL